jgi:hypothetical protein
VEGHDTDALISVDRPGGSDRGRQAGRQAGRQVSKQADLQDI